jgi:hypothetical protein
MSSYALPEELFSDKGKRPDRRILPHQSERISSPTRSGTYAQIAEGMQRHAAFGHKTAHSPPRGVVVDLACLALC